MTGPIQILRAHTQALHQALEATPMAQALLSPELTLARYADILAVWGAAWQILEPALLAAPFADTVPHLLPFPREQKAQTDLRYLDSLGLSVSASSLESRREPGLDFRPGPAQCAPSGRADLCGTAAGVWNDTPTNLSAFIGVCYVLRGASLGGKVIARHLERTLGLDAAHGAAFFNTESGDGLSWVHWMRSADAVLLSEGDVDAACRSAADTFGLLLQLFSAASAAAPGALARRRDPARGAARQEL